MEAIKFEWDENKNAINKRKHSISFEEAKTFFYDEEALVIDDPDHSGQEERFIRACLESPRVRMAQSDCVRMAQSDFSPDEAKTAGNTLCINEDFGKIWRKKCKPAVRGEILNRLLFSE